MKLARTLGGVAALLFVAGLCVMSGIADPAGASDMLYIAPVAFGAGIDDEQLKGAFNKIGEAFDAFKKSNEEQIDELKKGIKDPVLEDRLEKMGKTLDDGQEAVNKLNAAIDAEKKEREELEARINRDGIKATSPDAARREIELKDFNTTLECLAAQRKRGFTPLNEKGLDEYKSALNHLMRNGKDDLSPEEVKTLSVGSDPDGGYFVTPDTGGRIVKKVYESSPMRQVASQQTISTDKLQGIEDLGEAGAGYAGETSTSGDTTTPQVGEWEIPVYWIDTEPKATQQLLDDSAVNIEDWLSNKVSDKFARFENAEFVAGAVGKIRGITSYTTAADDGAGVTWGTMGHVLSGANGAFASSNPADKLHDLVGTLKNEYLNNARWMTRRSIITLIRKFKDGMGNYLWQPALTAGQPETLLGFPIARAEDMPALASGSISLAFGDFLRSYQIVDRQGIRVLRDPFTSKPYVKFYTTKRTGGGVVNYEAVKFLKFSAS